MGLYLYSFSTYDREHKEFSFFREIETGGHIP